MNHYRTRDSSIQKIDNGRLFSRDIGRPATRSIPHRGGERLVKERLFLTSAATKKKRKTERKKGEYQKVRAIKFALRYVPLHEGYYIDAPIASR